MEINLKQLISKLDSNCQTALESAAGYCLSRQHYNVEIEHWFIKLLENSHHELQSLIYNFGIDSNKLLTELNDELEKVKIGNSRAPALSPNIVNLIKNSWLLASVDYNHTQISSSHLIECLLGDETYNPGSFLVNGELKKINLDKLSSFIKNTITSNDQSEGNSNDIALSNRKSSNHTTTSALNKYTVNLTEAAKNGEIDTVVGRDNEIRQIIDIIIRRRQNNPILTGEAGVGKTAVVEGFALKIANGDVPDKLKNTVLLNLDLTLLQAGAGIKGEFETRLKSVIKEVKSSPKPIILFIDEAHTMVGAGGKEGQGDAANLLKPALARGELRTIAATTWSEYTKYFEKDAALTRRFQVVKIEEPSEKKAIDMMRSFSQKLQNHHGVRILDEAIIDAVKLSKRYMASRKLPDKAVSLLDTASARVALTQNSIPASIENTTRRIEQLNTNIKLLQKEIQFSSKDSETIESKIEGYITLKETYEETLTHQTEQWEIEKDITGKIINLQKKSEQLYSRENNKEESLEKTSTFIKSELCTNSEYEQDFLQSGNESGQTVIKKQIQALISSLKIAQGDSPMIKIEVDSQSISQVISNWTGIPVGKMVSNEIEQVMNLKKVLNDRIIGQNHALEAISQSIRTSRAGLTDPRKPVGVFFMVGSSGVGKTETALALADSIYGGEHNITTINMSEFKEEHKVSLLLGSPPGYVGYGEGGILTEAVRRKPHSVILLDEMEKAHPGVQDIFYNLFDKGTIKDGEGRDIDFRNCIIIMTSNAAEEHIRAICNASKKIPEPDVLLDNFRPQLLKYFKPAFLGRTTIIPYYPLSDANLIEICKISLGKIKSRIDDNYTAKFSYTDNVIAEIVARSQEVDTGARNIDSILTKTMLPDMASECLSLMAKNEIINTIHVDTSKNGDFEYQIN